MNTRDLLHAVGEVGGLARPDGSDPMQHFEAARNAEFQRYVQAALGSYEAHSHHNSPTRQASPAQLLPHRQDETYGRYNRDTVTLEANFNSGHAAIEGVHPQTLFFGSGMAAITAVLILVHGLVRSPHACIGLNCYFETHRLIRNMFRTRVSQEDDFKSHPATQLFWIDYLTSDAPSRAPDLAKIISAVIDRCRLAAHRDFYLVVDYTLSGFAFDIRRYIEEVPNNLHLLLVTSLQKHMSCGFDIATGGAVTVYTRSTVVDLLKRLRPNTGGTMGDKAISALPPIIPQLVRQTVLDSGKNAKRLADAIVRASIPKIRVHYDHTTDPLSSLVFVEIIAAGDHIARCAPYPSDRLIATICDSAKEITAPLVHGESFGFPCTRVVKYRGTLHEDVRFIRIAAGYDEGLTDAAVPAIVQGIDAFARSSL